MFEGKNKQRNKALAHVMSIALVFALFNRMMAMAPIDEESQFWGGAEQLNAAVVNYAEELLTAVDSEYMEIIELGQDIELDLPLIIPEDADVTINGNGHEMAWSLALAALPAIQIGAGALLTLEDVTVANQGEPDYSHFGAVGIEVGAGGVLTMGDGSVVRDFPGGGVAVNGGGFVLDGGTVMGNGSDYYGGGVMLDGGDFVMYSGEIRNNWARQGGGIYAKGASGIVLYGGQIHSNAAYQGGGIYLSPPADGAPYDENIHIEFGEDALDAIFDNHSNADYWPIANDEHHGDGIGIDDSAEFIEMMAGEDEDLPFVLVLPPDEENGEIEGEAEGEGEEGQEEQGEEGQGDDAEIQDEPEAEPMVIVVEFEPEPEPEPEAEPDYGPEDESDDEPQNGLFDFMVTNPQTGDEFSFFGLVASAVGFAMSVFLLLVLVEREKLKRAGNDMT
ncbi:MAG: right-handed parallel beta-helix repeat-containing protein [Clostridiales bacterium]|jgi:hypothetical protein|nr:right-handed parallel beta-helix repeat-containing protein [Clostridiales bacterium]